MARPTKYDPALHPQLAEAWATAGKIDREIAKKLGISEATLNTWKNQHKEFLESLKRGKAEPDDKVERSLYERATGYNFKSEKIITVPQGRNLGSKVERVPTVEHCPPDVTACIFWLTNRRPKNWRRRGELKLETDPDKEGVAFTLVKKRSAEEWDKKYAYGNPNPDKPKPSPAQPSSSSTAGRKAAGKATSSSGTTSRASKSTAKRGKASSSVAHTRNSKK